jgi:hypothetical protein
MGYKFTNEVTDTEGNVTVVETGEVPFWPLESPQVAVVLLICKGVITLQEGINITGLPAEHLINEAEAWAVAGELP